MDKKKKIQRVSEIADVFANYSVVLLVIPKALTVAEVTQFRRSVVAVGGYKLVKNKLAKVAVAKSKSMDTISTMLNGHMSLAYSNDPVAIAKLVSEFAKKTGKMECIGGVMNSVIVTPAEVAEIASLPSKDVIMAKLLSLINAPIVSIARLINSPSTMIARIMDQYSNV